MIVWVRVMAIPHTSVHRLTGPYLSRRRICSCLASDWHSSDWMSRTLAGLIREIFKPTLDFRGVIAEVLFMLVMVEVVRLVIIYLSEHRVAVDFMVDLGIISTLREVGCVALPSWLGSKLWP